MVKAIFRVIPLICWSFDVWRDALNSLVLSLRVNRGDTSGGRSIVLEPWNLILLGSNISIVVPIFVPSLVPILTSLIISIPIVVVVWLGSANFGIKFVLSFEKNFLVKLASLEVRGRFRRSVLGE